ncbi:MAG: tyrosine-type recombinase/integrase [Bacteroidaceae bacterium]|nr:tyrosine-type recombinase/integrase [Bacteroidaceae bacterium]
MESLVKTGGANTVTECCKEQSIDNAIGMFLAECDIRENSRVVYRRGLQCFFKWVAASGRLISELSRADIIAYKETLLGTHSNLTVSGYLVALRRFYEWAEGNKLYPNIARGIKSPKRKNAYLKEHLRTNQIHELLNHFEGNVRDYAIVNLMLRTGLRCIEVIRLNVEDITFKGGQRILKVWGKGRDDKDNFVVLTDKAYTPIKTYLDTRKTATLKEPLFVSTSNRNQQGRLTTRTISKICKEGFRAIGIDAKEYTAHSCRHSTAVMLLKNGTLADVQSVLRHASPATSQIYTRSIEEELRLQNPSEMKLDTAF